MVVFNIHMRLKCIIQRVAYGIMSLLSLLQLILECCGNGVSENEKWILIWGTVTAILIVQTILLNKFIWQLLMLLWIAYFVLGCRYMLDSDLFSSAKYSFTEAFFQIAQILFFYGFIIILLLFLKPCKRTKDKCSKVS